MNKLRKLLEETLRAGGLPVETGSLWRMGAPVKQGKVCVRLLRAEGEAGAVYHYLGTDEQGQEKYGMRLTVEFALVTLSPKHEGGEGAEAFGERVLELLLAAAGSIPVLRIEVEEAAYDSVRDCFTQRLRVKTAVLVCGTVEDGAMALEGFRLTAN